MYRLFWAKKKTKLKSLNIKLDTEVQKMYLSTKNVLKYKTQHKRK